LSLLAAFHPLESAPAGSLLLARRRRRPAREEKAAGRQTSAMVAAEGERNAIK